MAVYYSDWLLFLANLRIDLYLQGQNCEQKNYHFYQQDTNKGNIQKNKAGGRAKVTFIYLELIVWKENHCQKL